MTLHPFLSPVGMRCAPSCSGAGKPTPVGAGLQSWPGGVPPVRWPDGHTLFALQHTTGPVAGRPFLSLLLPVVFAWAKKIWERRLAAGVTLQPFLSLLLPVVFAQAKRKPPLCKGGTAWRSHAGGIDAT